MRLLFGLLVCFLVGSVFAPAVGTADVQSSTCYVADVVDVDVGEYPEVAKRYCQNYKPEVTPQSSDQTVVLFEEPDDGIKTTGLVYYIYTYFYPGSRPWQNTLKSYQAPTRLVYNGKPTIRLLIGT